MQTIEGSRFPRQTDVLEYLKSARLWCITCGAAGQGGAGRAPDDDPFENNDTFGTARNLGSLPGSRAGYTGLQIRDDDWYDFTTSADGLSGDFVRINFLHAQGDVDLALYNAAGTFLAGSAGETDAEAISLSGRPAPTTCASTATPAPATPTTP